MFASKRAWWALPILLVVLFVFWNPVGYVGGGADDDRYLASARCWLTHGPCLPFNHWEGRWPVIAPLTLSIGAIGVSRFSIGLPSLLASLACLTLLYWHGNRLFGRPVGLASALIFGLVPVFAIQALSSTVEPIELTAILLGFAVLRVERPLLAGLALGLAFQTRETSVLALPPALLLCRRNLKHAALVGVGFAFPLFVEFAYFYSATGDPLYRRGLSVEHTMIPSSELRVMNSGLPFFNASLMANWKYEPGVHIHWLIDGFANLLINLKTSFLFILVPMFYGFYRRNLNGAERHAALFLMASAFFYAAGLIYGLSIDPKPRMMYVPLAALSLVLGLTAVRSWNVVLMATFAAVVPLAGICLAAQPRHLHWQRAAESINSMYPGKIEMSQAGYFQLSPVLHDLPRTGSGKPYLMLIKSKPCLQPSSEDPFDLRHVRLVEERPSVRLAAALGYPWHLCLFKYPSGFKAPSGQSLSESAPKA